MKIAINEKQIQQIIKLIDLDANGSITLDEFKKLFAKVTDVEQKGLEKA